MARIKFIKIEFGYLPELTGNIDQCIFMFFWSDLYSTFFCINHPHISHLYKLCVIRVSVANHLYFNSRVILVYQPLFVASSSHARFDIASVKDEPHSSLVAVNSLQTRGRSAYIRHLFSADKCTHLVPAGFPCPVPGIMLDMDCAIQQAPHMRQSVFVILLRSMGNTLYTLSI